MTAREARVRALGVHVLVAGISGANPCGPAFPTCMGFAHADSQAQVGPKADWWLDRIVTQKIIGLPDDAAGGTG